MKTKQNIEKQVLENQAKLLAQEIDREVLWNMMCELGWVRVDLPAETDVQQSIEIVEWLRKNIDNPYEKAGRKFIFKDEKDAMWFKLRWLS